MSGGCLQSKFMLTVASLSVPPRSIAKDHHAPSAARRRRHLSPLAGVAWFVARAERRARLLGFLCPVPGAKFLEDWILS